MGIMQTSNKQFTVVFDDWFIFYRDSECNWRALCTELSPYWNNDNTNHQYVLDNCIFDLARDYGDLLNADDQKYFEQLFKPTGELLIVEYDFEEWSCTLEYFELDEYDLNELKPGESETIEFRRSWSLTEETYRRFN